jgi:hypothetical protein
MYIYIYIYHKSDTTNNSEGEDDTFEKGTIIRKCLLERICSHISGESLVRHGDDYTLQQRTICVRVFKNKQL